RIIDAANVKVMYALTRDGDYQDIVQHNTMSVATNMSGKESGTASFPVWKYQSDEEKSTYYHKVRIASYTIDGKEVKPEDSLYEASFDEKTIMYYDEANDRPSNTMVLRISYRGVKVSFDLNNENADASTCPQSYDTIPGSMIGKPVDPTATHYSFAGWYKDKACTQIWNFETDKVMGDTTLYAKWIPKTFIQLVYDKNAEDAVGSMYDESTEAGATIKTAVNRFERPGYTFSGWNTSADGTGTTYAENSDYVIQINSEKKNVLYAQWKKVSGEPEPPVEPEPPAGPETPVEPETPTEPGTPVEPETPAEPETPSGPETPVEPETPTEPGTPVEPETPVEPGTPVEPETPAEPETPSGPETPVEPETPAEPGTPVEPETPAEPGTPAEPETPTEPGTPTEPETPAEPETPVEPETPSESETPDSPVIPEEPKNSDRSDSRKDHPTASYDTEQPDGVDKKLTAPQTGDDSQMGLWTILLFVSALALAVIELVRRKILLKDK
ncbi:MAG: InlB B-repeat-containing protein, partial [bacterium]|nr:InlB B-repeat-containing protein [bacterium]